ncbi:unnamed protein product [Malus baccata var. baccata]
MAGLGSSKVRTLILSGENYEFWRIKMVTIFNSYGLWNLVENGISKKKVKAEEDTNIDDEADEKMATIFMKDAKALGIFQSAVSNQIFPRIANADLSKLAWDLLYEEYHDGDQDLINQMKTFGGTLSNERLVQEVLISLTKMYDHICLVIENTKSLESIELQEVVAILKSQDQIAIIKTRVNGNWYINSGCSNHMTGNVELLVDVRINVIGKVQMPTGNLVDVVGTGSLVIDTNAGKKYIMEVMFLPSLKENLLSVGHMDEHGYYLLFGGGICCVFNGPSLNCLVIKVKMKGIRVLAWKTTQRLVSKRASLESKENSENSIVVTYIQNQLENMIDVSSSRPRKVEEGFSSSSILPGTEEQESVSHRTGKIAQPYDHTPVKWRNISDILP